MNQFSGIVGGSAAIEHIQNALRRKEVSHAYIISGEPGSGRMQLARTYAAALLCAHPTEVDGRIEPCGVCPACLKTASLNHPDMQIYTQERLSAQDRSKNAIGIKLIRMMTADVSIRPYEGGRKIYIIPDADRMTVEAQNALLKTLEEPPAYAVLMLLSNGTGSFLPTILSRCVTLRLYPMPQHELAGYLENELGVTADRARVAAGLSHGNPGMARRIAESEEYQALYDKTMDVWCRLIPSTAYDNAQAAIEIAEMGPIGMLAHKDQATEQKGQTRKKGALIAGISGEQDTAASTDPLIAPVDAFLDLLQYAIRDILVCKSTGKTDDLILRDRIPYSSRIAQRLDYQTLQRVQDAFMTAQRRRSAGGRDEQILEVMLLDIREIMRQAWGNA